jgi:3-hydroxyacyl-CoA dehydrogenase
MQIAFPDLFAVVCAGTIGAGIAAVAAAADQSVVHARRNALEHIAHEMGDARHLPSAGLERL